VVRRAVHLNAASNAFQQGPHTLDTERQGTFLPSGLSFSFQQVKLGFFVELSALEHFSRTSDHRGSGWSKFGDERRRLVRSCRRVVGRDAAGAIPSGRLRTAERKGRGAACLGFCRVYTHVWRRGRIAIAPHHSSRVGVRGGLQGRGGQAQASRALGRKVEGRITRQVSSVDLSGVTVLVAFHFLIRSGILRSSRTSLKSSLPQR
jgi:hypothetical protein